MIRRTQIPMLVSAVRTLTYSSLFHVIVLLFPALLPRCTPCHPGWRRDVFWLRNSYSLFSTGFLSESVKGDKCFFVITSVLYQTCFSDSSTPPARKDVFSVSGCPSELAQGLSYKQAKVFYKGCVWNVWSHIASLLSFSVKKENCLARGIHYVE